MTYPFRNATALESSQESQHQHTDKIKNEPPKLAYPVHLSSLPEYTDDRCAESVFSAVITEKVRDQSIHTNLHSLLDFQENTVKFRFMSTNPQVSTDPKL